MRELPAELLAIKLPRGAFKVFGVPSPGDSFLGATLASIEWTTNAVTGYYPDGAMAFTYEIAEGRRHGVSKS